MANHNILFVSLFCISVSTTVSSFQIVGPFRHCIRCNVPSEPHSIVPVGRLSCNSTHLIPTTKSSALYSRRKKDENKDVIDAIVSPLEKIINILSNPLGPSSLPLIYPLSVVTFNLLFNDTTSFIFDASFISFFLLIRQIRISNDEGPTESPVLDAVALFGSAFSSVLISPLGLNLRDTLSGFEALFIPLSFSLGVAGITSSFLNSKAVDPFDESSIEIGEKIDPSMRLMEIWDEKLSNVEKDE